METHKLDLPIKKPVKHFPTSAPEKPVVSVCVQTYQHAKYIEQCLDGILMQKTSFPFEVLLGEDESTDGTREICIEYAKKHPDKIRLFLHRRENVIIIGGQPTGRFNFLYNLKEARGKYIALCEGDDYWTDPHKLQKQVDFLENHTEYSACAHDVDVFFEDEFKRKIYFYNKDMHYFNEAMHYFYPTCSVVFRANLINENNVKLLSNPKLRGGDKLLQMIFFKFGPIKYIDQKMGVYRKHASGVSFERKKKDYDSTKAFLNAVLTIYDKKHRKNIHKRIVVAYADKSRDLRLSKQWLDFLSSFMGAILHVKSFTSLKILLKDSFKSN